MTWLSKVPGLRDVVRESDEETLPRSNTLRIGDGLVAVYDTATRSISLAYDADFGANAESIRGNPIATSVATPGEGTFLSWDAGIGEWTATVPPGSGDISAPIDPDDDGKVGIADGGNLVYLAGTTAGNVLRWNGAQWDGQPIDLEVPASADDIGDGRFLQGSGAGNVAVDDVVANGQLGWGAGEDAGGLTGLATLTSTDDTPTERVVIAAPTNAVVLLVVVIMARDTGAGDARIWELKRKFKWDSGTAAAMSATVVVSDDGDAGSSTWIADLDIGGGGEDAVAVLTGRVATTIEWRVISQDVYYLG